MSLLRHSTSIGSGRLCALLSSVLWHNICGPKGVDLEESPVPVCALRGRGPGFSASVWLSDLLCALWCRSLVSVSALGPSPPSPNPHIPITNTVKSTCALETFIPKTHIYSDT